MPGVVGELVDAVEVGFEPRRLRRPLARDALQPGAARLVGGGEGERGGVGQQALDEIVAADVQRELGGVEQASAADALVAGQRGGAGRASPPR